MGIIWSMYGIGYKGAAPTWKVVDVVRSEPGSGEVVLAGPSAETLPLPDELPDPVELRDNSEALIKAFPPTQRGPHHRRPRHRGSDDLHEELNEQAAPWRILETSNKYTGETQAVVAEALGPDGQNMFASATRLRRDRVVPRSAASRAAPTTASSDAARWKVGSVFDQSPPDSTPRCSSSRSSRRRPSPARRRPPRCATSPSRSSRSSSSAIDGAPAPPQRAQHDHPHGRHRPPCSAACSTGGTSSATAQRAGSGGSQLTVGQYLPILVMLVLGVAFAGGQLGDVEAASARSGRPRPSPRPTSAASCPAANRRSASRCASTWWP